MSNSSIWPIVRTLSAATTPGQSEPASNDNEGILHILQISRTGALPSEGLVLYLGHSLGVRSYPSAEMRSVYSAPPADWAKEYGRRSFQNIQKEASFP